MSEALRGRFLWYQLMTPDPAAAQEFYTRLLGWGIEVWEGGGAPYTMWTNNGMPLGGMMHLPKEAVAAGARPHWMGYVGTPDVDATAARASELGATMMVPPSDIPEVGRFAVLNDPQGALLAIYKPGEWSNQPLRRARVGEVEWHELATSNPPAAIDFYGDLFGWEKIDSVDMGEMGFYHLFGLPGSFPIGGMFQKPAEMPGPSMWLYYVRVADLHAALEQVRALGGQVLMGPHQVPDGDLIAQCLDPQGGAFALHWSERKDD